MGQAVTARRVALFEDAAAPRPVRRGNFTLGLGAVLVVLVGLDLRPGIVSMGPLIIPLRTAFGLSHAGAALLTAIPDVSMGLLAVLAPGLARRFGRDRVIVAALTLLAGTTVARAFAGSTGSLFIATAGVGAGIAVSGALVGGFVKASFPDRPALLMGFYTGALSLGSTLSAGLTGPVASWGDWQRAVGAGLLACLEQHGEVPVGLGRVHDVRSPRPPPTGLRSGRRPPALLSISTFAWWVSLFSLAATYAAGVHLLIATLRGRPAVADRIGRDGRTAAPMTFTAAAGRAERSPGS